MPEYSDTIRIRQEEAKAEILKFAQEMPIDSYVCKKVGIGRSTLYRWFEDDKNFKKKFKDSKRIGMSLISDIAESNIIKNIKNGNQRAIEFWLKHHKADYAPQWDTKGNFKLPHELVAHESIQRNIDPNSQL